MRVCSVRLMQKAEGQTFPPLWWVLLCCSYLKSFKYNLLNARNKVELKLVVDFFGCDFHIETKEMI